MRVLEEGDKDERVGHAVTEHHLREAARRRPVEGTANQDDTDVADDDLVALVRGESDG